MKNIRYISLLILVALVTSCGENFLEKKDLYEVSDETYYSNPEEVQTALAAAYSTLPTTGVNDALLIANLMSDDCLGGGGWGDTGFHDIDGFTNSSEDLYLPIWQNCYKGILRVNMIIYRIDNAKYSNETEKNRDLGEAYFLRGVFYLRLAQIFGNVPLITLPDAVNYPKAETSALFGQILFDFKKAIELMPSTKYADVSTDRLGHATKWAAEGFIARAFLFYTGKYNVSDATLADGTTLTKSDVIAYVDDCVANSGHGLIPDFRNQWPYAYANTTYKYAVDNKLNWVGETGDNVETMFALKFSPYGGWNSPTVITYSNQLTLYMGIRTGGKSYQDFGQGWGGGPVNPQLFESFEAGDPRKAGSITDVTDPIEGDISTKYVWNADNSVHETGLWQKKYTPILVNGSGMYNAILGAGTQTNYQLWNMQDEVLLRFADVLLMGAELGSAKAQDYFDRVRTRAGLATKTVSLDAIKDERRHELAFEGLRYYDLLRWHDEVAAFAKATNIKVQNLAIEDTYSITYRPETNGFAPIPESQVKLSDGILVQNPGW